MKQRESLSEKKTVTEDKEDDRIYG